MMKMNSFTADIKGIRTEESRKNTSFVNKQLVTENINNKVEIQEIYSRTFFDKGSDFRESNVFTKDVTKDLISRNSFVAKEFLIFSHCDSRTKNSIDFYYVLPTVHTIFKKALMLNKLI